MSANPINLESFRTRRSRARVMDAIDKLYEETKFCLADDEGVISPQDREEFLLQVLVDHLSANAEDLGVGALDEDYRRFDGQLRHRLQTRLRTLKHFANVRP